MKNDEKLATFDEMNTAPAIVLNLPNAVFEKFSGKKSTLPVWLSGLILGAVIFLPSYTLAFLLGETRQIKEIGWTVFTSLQLSYCSVIVIYIDININIFGYLKRKIIPSIASEKELVDLRNCVQLATTHKYIPSILLLGIAVGLIAFIGGTLAYGSNPGYGLPISAIFFGIFGGISLYYLIWVMKLTLLLSSISFSINEFMPVSSKIIYDISGMLNTHLYIVALFTAIVTTIDSLDKLTAWFVWIDILFAWLPISAQFFLTQNTIRKIIANAKWTVLEQIQSEIRALKISGHLNDKDTTDAINRLLDLHDRIEKTRDSTFDFKSGLDFLNQLMLPVAGWIIVNVEKLLSLINSLLTLVRH